MSMANGGKRKMIARQSPAMAKQRDAESYDRAAPQFACLTERFSTPLAQKILSLAKLSPGADVLDVGTGTGLVARLVARLVPGGRVIGIDHSSGMLEQAANRAAKDGLGGMVTFQAMDAEQLKFLDRSF